MNRSELTQGRLIAIAAYLFWGIFPVYWKILKTVPAYEILLHRMFWSFLFVMTLLAFRKNWKWINSLIKNRKTLFTFLLTSSLICGNWLTFIWAINSGYMVEASLGYFINPLISILLGMIFLKEKLNRYQAVAVLLAACGIVYLTVNYGKIPWVALVLAFCFGTYGLLRKTAKLEALEGFAAETMFMFIPALIALIYLENAGRASFLHSGFVIDLSLFLAGAVTATPLIMFAVAARKIPLSNIGILQYITPTMHFLLGVFIYGEEFTYHRQIGFAFVWTALIIYTLNGFLSNKKNSHIKKIKQELQ